MSGFDSSRDYRGEIERTRRLKAAIERVESQRIFDEVADPANSLEADAQARRRECRPLESGRAVSARLDHSLPADPTLDPEA